MKIGIMLRCFDERGGVGVYTRNVTRELLELDDRNEYVLFYRNPENLGTHAHRERVAERVVSAPHTLLWDQVAIPRACAREGVDVVFHPKFSVPLLGSFGRVMVLHGPGWFVPEVKHFWTLRQRLYARLTMPVYCRRANAVLAVSQFTTDVYNDVFDLPEGRVQTVHLAPARHFRPIEDKAQLERVRQKYGLPERFVLTLSGHDRGPRKNIGVILEAFRVVRRQVDCKLVVAGRDCERFRTELEIPDNGLWNDVVFPGWVDQKDLPAFFSLSDLFLYPSKCEAFPIPVSEAFVCGAPVVTSDRFGLKEVGGEAAVLVDPLNPEAVAEAVSRILLDPAARASLREASIARSRRFTWDRCARETLAAIEGAAASAPSSS